MADTLLAAGLRQALLLSLAVLLLQACRPLLRRLGAVPAYAAWSLVPAFLLAAALPIPGPGVLQVVAATPAAAAAGVGAARLAAWPAVPALPSGSASALLALWLAGTLAVAGVQVARQRRLIRQGERLPAGCSPALVGLIRPRVVLPEDFDQRFTAAERTLILAHEQVHRDRLDNLWSLLTAVLVALHWWNPLAWWAAGRMRADQELACDATVLAARPDCGPTYAQALLAAHDLRATLAPLASRWRSAHPLIERVAMLNRPIHHPRRRAAWVVAGVAAIAGLAWMGRALATTEAAGPPIKVSLLIAQQVDDRIHRQSLALAGPQRQPMRMAVAGGGGDGHPGLALEVTARQLDAQRVLIEAVLQEGVPLAVTARPRLVIHLGEPALVEQVDPATRRRTSVVFVPRLAD